MLHLAGELTYDTVRDLAVLPPVKIGRGYGVNRGSFLIFRHGESVAGTRSKFRTVIVLVHHDHFQNCDVEKFVRSRHDGHRVARNLLAIQGTLKSDLAIGRYGELV